MQNGKARGKKKHNFSVSTLSSFGENSKGELFFASLGGSIFRLAA